MFTHSARRSARHAERVVAILLSALLILLDAAVAESGPTQAAKVNSSPNGLVVVLENKPEQGALDLRGLNNPLISCVALQIRWRDIEPVQGRPDWSKLDQGTVERLPLPWIGCTLLTGSNS